LDVEPIQGKKKSVGERLFPSFEGKKNLENFGKLQHVFGDF